MPMRLNHWPYVAIVILGAVSLSALAEVTHKPIFFVFATVLIAFLTHPLGLFAGALAFPLVYAGIATPAEAVALFSPLFALLGYLQWYVLLPRLFERWTGEKASNGVKRS